MDGTIIADASETLRALVEDGVRIAFPAATATLEPPNLAQPQANEISVSVWLHMVERHPDLLNVPPRRVAVDRVERRPLPLRLHYLMTPLGADTLTRQRVLGMAMQTMHDNAFVEPGDLEQPLINARIRSLSIHLNSQSLEDLTRVWHALTRPYELSACYLVDVLPLPSMREDRAGPPVVEKRLEYAAVPSGGRS